jgi:hypothetical protein
MYSIDGAEREAAQLGRVAASGQDHDRQLGLREVQFLQHVETVAAREQQVEDRQVVVALTRQLQTALAVCRPFDGEALRRERPGQERANPYLVLHHQYSHDPHLLFSSGDPMPLDVTCT